MTGQPAIVFHRLPGLNPAREPNSNVASQGAAQIAQLPAHIVILNHFSGQKHSKHSSFCPASFALVVSLVRPQSFTSSSGPITAFGKTTS